MSNVNHPNLHAVGFTMDILNSLESRVRGTAKDIVVSDILLLTQNEILSFVERIECLLDLAASVKE
jgi:hypothetical protein